MELRGRPADKEIETTDLTAYQQTGDRKPPPKNKQNKLGSTLNNITIHIHVKRPSIATSLVAITYDNTPTEFISSLQAVVGSQCHTLIN
jgi:hypothetical protein